MVYIFGVVCPAQEVDTRQVVRSEIEETGKKAGEEDNCKVFPGDVGTISFTS